MSYRTGKEGDAINRDPFSVFPNTPEHQLSYGEITAFNRFQNYTREIVRGSIQVQDGHRAYIGQDNAIIRCVQSKDGQRPLLQIAVGLGSLVEITYTLTGQGLVRKTMLPGEIKPKVETLRGMEAQVVLTNLQQNLRP